jgi:hypothetical protein
MIAEVHSDTDYIEYDEGHLNGVGTLYMLSSYATEEEVYLVDSEGKPFKEKIENKKIGFY